MARQNLPEALRREAYYAYLDGRTARAKDLNHEADRLDRAAHRLAALIQQGA